jgi:hypothetical protein
MASNLGTTQPLDAVPACALGSCAGLFKAFAVRDNQLITGQQQYSGTKVAQLVIEAQGI